MTPAFRLTLRVEGVTAETGAAARRDNGSSLTRTHARGRKVSVHSAIRENPKPTAYCGRARAARRHPHPSRQQSSFSAARMGRLSERVQGASVAPSVAPSSPYAEAVKYEYGALQGLP